MHSTFIVHIFCTHTHTHTLVFLLNGSVDSIHIICTLSCDTSTWNRRESLGNTSLCVCLVATSFPFGKNNKVKSVYCLCTSENQNKGHRTKGNVLPHLLSACLCVFHNPFRLRVKRNICTASILSPLIKTQLLTAVNACWCYKAHTFNPLSLCWVHIHTQREQQVRSPTHYHGSQTHLSARVSPALSGCLWPVSCSNTQSQSQSFT